MVDVKVSKPVAIMSKNPKSKFSLLLKVKGDKIQLVTTDQKKKETKQDVKVASLKDDAWQEELHTKLVDIKKKFPAEFELKIEPEEKIELEYLMAIMDTARSLKKTDGKIIRKDKATGKDVKVKYLFPKVTLTGVYG